MQPRQSVMDLFTAFIQFQADRFSHWVIDARLKRSMQRCLDSLNLDANHSESIASSERFWSLYWHQHWQAAHPLAIEHLVAYLQEPCYWSAHLTCKRFANPQYSLSDYFQMAITEVHIILRDFDAHKGASLKTFATIAFPRLLRDLLRQRHAADLCSDWTLLRRTSKKRLTEALEHQGLSPLMITQYQLVWRCFQQVWVQDSPLHHSPPLDRQIWETITHDYNAEHGAYPGLNPTTPEAIERWLMTCATWIRQYLYPPIDSLNRTPVGYDTGELQDQMAAPLSTDALTQLIEQEERQEQTQQQEQLQSLLKTALTQLDAQSQSLLRLYYQEHLTQQEIVHRTQLSQATVSRRLTKAREALLTALVQWSQILNRTVNPTQIITMSTSLEAWLVLYYGSLQLTSPPS